MKNLLNYHKDVIVDRVVPKTMFYKFMEVNPRMKVRFVNDVEKITWLYKLSANTLNVTSSDDLVEIDVFVATLKQQDCPTDLFTFIDTNMPHHIVFILEHDNSYMILLNYKDWADNTHTKFKITKSFASLWMDEKRLSLEIQGQSLSRVYENFVAQVSGIGEHKAGAMAEIVDLKKRIAAMEAELQNLQKKMRKEPQYDKQVKMNKQVKAKRHELDELKEQLEQLK
jgi:hypothetical protein